MSATTRRLPLEQADALAAEVVDLLRPYTTRIEVAGSVRRRKPNVGDLEIVCMPRLEQPTMLDLFGDRSSTAPPHNLLDIMVEEWRDRGVFGDRLDKNGRAAAGERYKRLTYKGIGLDLFSVVPGSGQQWGVILTIRTGSAEFSHKLVTSRLLGGWLPAGHKVTGGAIVNGSSGLALDTPEELDVFAFLGLPVLAPERRTATVHPYRAGGEWRWRDPVAATGRQGLPA